MPVEPKYRGRTLCLIGTGPSLTLSQVEAARSKGFVLCGVNLVYRYVPDLAVLFATNENFWANYDDWRAHPCEKWTNCKEAADRYGLQFVDSRNAPGLSADPALIHHGHSSGFCLLNLAYLLGARRIVLLGYDLKFAHDYCGYEKRLGSTPRHFFGEYVAACQHWPKVEVRDGVHFGLQAIYAAVAKQALDVEIVNCTPDSALQSFPRTDISDCHSD